MMTDTLYNKRPSLKYRLGGEEEIQRKKNNLSAHCGFMIILAKLITLTFTGPEQFYFLDLLNSMCLFIAKLIKYSWFMTLLPLCSHTKKILLAHK